MSSLYSWPGLAEVRVQIDERRQEPGARALDDADPLACARQPSAAAPRADARDDAALDDDVDLVVEPARRIDGAHVLKHEGSFGARHWALRSTPLGRVGQRAGA